MNCSCTPLFRFKTENTVGSLSVPDSSARDNATLCSTGSSEGHSPVLNLSKTGGDHSGPASDRSAGGHTNVDDEDDLDEDDDNISDGEEDDIKDHGTV